MRYYPVGLDLLEQRVLLVGAGSVAARKCARLVGAGARVAVVALRTNTAFDSWAVHPQVLLIERAFCASDVQGARLVIAATNDRTCNAQIAAAAQAAGIPVNVVDDPELCTATLPAVIERGPITLAIATGGLAPAIASWLRGRLEAWLDPALGGVVELLGRMRERIRAEIPLPEQRRALYHEAAEGAVAEAVRNGDQPAAELAFARLLANHAQPSKGIVTLVGAGPGDPGLLTLAAMRALQDADVVFYDRLVGTGVLKLARAEAELVDVGKRCGQPSTAQADIHSKLIAAAQAGKKVVRLKGGDPLTFARGGEELLALKSAGIRYRVVPGVTAASACAAYAGIPLTHRGVARSVRLVTAHSREGLTPFELLRFRPDETLAIYMGSQRAEQLAEALQRAGVPANTEIAFVENASLPQQRVCSGQVKDLAQLAAKLSKGAPAFLIVGAVCALAAELHWFGARERGVENRAHVQRDAA